jgi:HAD superfamily hydrolase (TIGR01509 family)
MSRVRAALFDLDGTLVDSEMYTDQTIAAVVGRYGIANFALPPADTRGRTWAYVADIIRSRTKIGVSAPDLSQALLEYWNAAAVDVKPIPGAAQALRTAAGCGLRLGVVSSSPRSVIDTFLAKLGVSDYVVGNARVGGDHVRNTKPDPEGYLLAARALDVTPGEALVFEDSQAGLLAARAAGMRSIFITCCATDVPGNTTLATAACLHYEALPARFWEGLVAGTIDLHARSFTG